MQIDIGFGDVVFPGGEAVNLRPVLDFAPAPIRAYTAESSIAEKLQAMVKLGAINRLVSWDRSRVLFSCPPER